MELAPRVLRLCGQWFVARRDSGQFEKNSTFCQLADPKTASVALFCRRNPAVKKSSTPVSPGDKPLAKEPGNSRFRAVKMWS